MSGFQEMAAADLHGVFLNPDEFAQRHTVRYDGETYPDIPLALTAVRQQDREPHRNDHAQGLYLATAVLHGALSDFHGVQPEKGRRIEVSEPRRDGRKPFFRTYYVAASSCELGMLRLELEVLDE